MAGKGELGMRLINADIENERLLDFIAQHDIGIKYALEHKDMTILEDIFFEYFNEQVAFDLESVINQLEERIRNFKSLNSDEQIVDVAIKEIQRDLEIIKSATNATNGKDGGRGMSDLISRSALLDDFRNTITERSNTIDLLNMIVRQPIAFDWMKVINKIDDTVPGITNLQLDMIIEILKSAANSTNGKNGG